MLLVHNSCGLFYPPIRTFSPKTKHANLLKINAFSSKRSVMPCKRYSSFTSNCHSPELKLPAVAAASPEDMHTGIGILEFFKGKNILVTGATGFLGKVLVEKILRSTQVGKVYLLIKAKDEEAATDRLYREILNSELFTCLKEMHGESYEAFMREKLIPIAGDICEPNLGMDYYSSDAVRKDVHVIIHSAAITTFYERYDLIVDANVITPQRIMRFAKTCKKLQLFTHVSTAYVNGRREGIIFEKPLIMGESGRNDVDDDGAQLDVADEISLLLNSPTNLSEYEAKRYFKKLGQQRAEVFGWNTTYQLCKGMGEMVLNEIRGDVPLLIIRPAIVESCYRQPLPGWIQGNKVFDPVAICYGKGMLPAYYANPEVSFDIIPADFVVNTMIAAIAKHGSRNMGPVNVYHVASAVSNPIILFDIFEYLYEYYEEEPLIKGSNIAKIKFFENFDEFSKYTREEIFRRNNGANADQKTVRQLNAKVEYAEQLCKIYAFIGFFKARFDMGNSEKLIEEMSKEEQVEFGVDVRDINWKKYFLEIHLPGLQKHVINSI